MPSSSSLPSRWRGGINSRPSPRPRWYDRFLSPVFLSLASQACAHPIHTVVIFAFLASTTYLGLLENSLFSEPDSTGAIGKADFQSLLVGSKTLHLGENTNWKWTLEDDNVRIQTQEASQDLALITLLFPDSAPNGMPSTAPAGETLLPGSKSAQLLPSSTNILSSLSNDASIAFSVPYDEAAAVVSAIHELQPPTVAKKPVRSEAEGTVEERKWIMKAVKVGSDSSNSKARWVQNAWTSFVDILKNAETLDVIIMTLGYLSMHLTFVSLFLSMRRLGSNVWLATSVLFGSVFAFLFALHVTAKFGIHLNMILLSEGLPFLVVTVGFEKPIILTKTVLAASLEARRRESEEGNSPTIQKAIKTAVRERGYDIIRDYAIEIAILVAGAASGVQGGLRPFCFLAAWILFFDCLLLFTFYTAILTIKLEINRIKRHVALRKALEEDGVSRTVAEEVASSNDWPRVNDAANQPDGVYSIFGRKIRESSVPKFKVLMVSGFIIVNLLNLCTIPFRGAINKTYSATSSLSSVVTQPPLDPFKVASNGLDFIFNDAKSHNIETRVTILAPIKYELQYPSIYYASKTDTNGSFLDNEYADHILDNMGGRVVEGVLKSLEDPALSKWIIAALALSVVLNGYLFNAARWTIKDPRPRDEPAASNEVLDAPSDVDESVANPPAARPQPAIRERTVPAPRAPPTPAPEDDEQHKRELEARVPMQLDGSRTFEECVQLVKEKRTRELTDAELVELSLKGKVPGYALEKSLGDMTRAVKIRRAVVSRTHATRETSTLLEGSKLPYMHFDYERVHGACCENVIGYTPLPLGVAGPLNIDGQNYFLPMATTEGVLVASTSRGAKAINAGGGVTTVLTGDGMTRGPCIGFDNLARAGAAKLWLDSEDGQKMMKNAFNSTSSYARLQSMKTALAGTNLFIRFKTTTGDAMGMNMISKGVEKALTVMASESGFDDMRVISVSGNYCTDKKPAAINWIDGRGKSVVAEAIIPANIVETVLKSDVDAMVELNISKNLVGSAMAGSIGGFNAHAANIVTAIYLATGQDPAQNVESSNCITLMQKDANGNLQISVSMPSIEVGTIGGGTILEPQAAMLDLLGVRGAHPTNPGDNSRQLARIIAAAVLAGELSLCGALAAGHLVRAHMAHNRSAVPSRATTPGPGANGVAGAQTPTSLAMSSIRDENSRLMAPVNRR